MLPYLLFSHYSEQLSLSLSLILIFNFIFSCFLHSQNDGNTLVPVGKPNFGIYFSDILPRKTDRNGSQIRETESQTDLAGLGKLKKQNSVTFQIVDDEENEEKYDREKEVVKEEEKERRGDSDGESDDEDEDKNAHKMNGKNNENEKFEAMKVTVEKLKTVNKKVSVAFQHPEFTELASEILRNTFQNLILESLCGEFQLSESIFSEKENVPL